MNTRILITGQVHVYPDAASEQGEQRAHTQGTLPGAQRNTHTHTHKKKNKFFDSQGTWKQVQRFKLKVPHGRLHPRIGVQLVREGPARRGTCSGVVPCLPPPKDTYEKGCATTKHLHSAACPPFLPSKHLAKMTRSSSNSNSYSHTSNPQLHLICTQCFGLFGTLVYKLHKTQIFL